MTQIFTPFCRSRRADSKYIYFVGSHKVFFYYNYIIGGKIPRLIKFQDWVTHIHDKQILFNNIMMIFLIIQWYYHYKKIMGVQKFLGVQKTIFEKKHNE